MADIASDPFMTDIASEGFPRVLPMRERSRVTDGVLAERLDTVLPIAMREAGLDMWLIICQEDDLDPVYETMIPMETWCPILQRPGAGGGAHKPVVHRHEGPVRDAVAGEEPPQ